MAETPIPITTGSGTASVAADNISGTSYQQVKIVDATLGSTNALIVNPDGTFNARISGSVATAGGSFTGSVSGTLGSSIIGQLPAGTAVLGSITALQGTNPWQVVGSVSAGISNTNLNVGGSVIAFQGGTQTTSIVGGASVFQAGPWTTSVVQATNPWIITGSVQGTFNAGNSSVQVLNFPTTQNISGSVVAFQGTNPFIITGSVQGSFSAAANQSVSGTVGASVIGTTPVTQSGTWYHSVLIASVIGAIPVTGSFSPAGNQSVSGTVNIGTGGPVSVLGTMSVLGTVPVTQSTTPWIITGSVQGSFSPSGNQSVSGTVGVTQQGTWYTSILIASVIGAIPVTGSFSPAGNQSVSGTVGASVIGIVPVTQSGAWTQSVVGTYSDSTVSSTVTGIPFMFKANISSSIMQAVSPLFPLPASVQGTVGASILGIVPVQVTGTVPSQSVSGTVGASIVGQLPAGTAVLGSVAVLQGSNPWIETFSNSSILAVPVGSTITVFQAPSIVGTYLEDNASANQDRGLFVLGVRNDTLASVTSTDADYGALTIGPSGEVITANAPLTKWFYTTGSVFNGGSVAVLGAQGGSIFSYVTAIQLSNMSANNALITVTSNGSILAYQIAPANGGSNVYYPNGLKSQPNTTINASVSAISSVYVNLQGFISKS